MPHTKTPGGQAASEKFLKKESQSKRTPSLPLPNSLSLSLFLSLHPKPTYELTPPPHSPEHGEGAPNAPGHTEGKAPGEAPVASDSGNVATGVEKGTNQPGEKGVGGVDVGVVPENLKETRGV